MRSFFFIKLSTTAAVYFRAALGITFLSAVTNLIEIASLSN